MAKVEQVSGNRKGKRIWIPLGIVCGGILVVLGGIFLWAGWQGYQEAPKLIEGSVPQGSSGVGYLLTPDQAGIQTELGPPEAFTLLFYEEETVDGSLRDVRLESWDYYSQGVGYTFINGELTGEDELDISEIGQLAPMPYDPEQFEAYMSLNEVLAAASLETYVEIPLEKAFLEGGDLYYGESLTFGLVDGELRYLEALALIEE
ncbi:MAG: hypothetical protein R6U57_07890 [Anaerolineales bacterium]